MSASNSDGQRSPAKDKGSNGDSSADLGKALKTVYDETVREEVPDDFLALLNKLS